MKCTKCLIEKDQSEFYFRKDNNKYRSDCKECVKAVSKKSYHEKYEDEEYRKKESIRKRDFYRDNKSVSLFDRRHLFDPNLTYKQRFPEKDKATNSTKSIRRAGFHCHHWSYRLEHHKDVIYLTQPMHIKAHRYIIYDPERYMYRRYDTNELLDTKESHEAFILTCLELNL